MKFLVKIKFKILHGSRDLRMEEREVIIDKPLMGRFSTSKTDANIDEFGKILKKTVTVFQQLHGNFNNLNRK